MSRTNLLIVESGFQDVREYWLQDLKAHGYQLYLTQPWPLSWEAPYVEDYLQCQLNKWGSEERSLIINFCRKHQIKGVLALNEGTVPFVQDLNQALGFPTLADTDIHAIRNKFKMRERLQGVISQPGFIRLSAENPLPPSVSFPAVVKPVELMSSLGVRLVNNGSELYEAVTNARNVDFEGENLREHYSLSSDVLIEEYLPGDEYSIESILQDGQIVESFLTKKFKSREPYFFEVGHIANYQVPAELLNRIEEFNAKIHQHLQIKNAITHTEIRIKDDKPFLMEIACRPGGDLIPLAHGIGAQFSFPAIAGSIMTGRSIESRLMPQKEKQLVGIFFPFKRIKGSKAIYSKQIRDALKECEIYRFMHNEADQFSEEDSFGYDRIGQIVFTCQSNSMTEERLNSLIGLFS